MDKILRTGYLLAGLTNVVGILVVSSFFTSEAFLTPFPTIFGEFGAIMIMVWGLAYWSVIDKASTTLWPAIVFAIEKAVYVIVWLIVVLPSLSEYSDLISSEPIVHTFYRTFGLVDLAYGLFFAFAASHAYKKRSSC